MSEEPCTHVVVVRAVDAQGGANCQVKVSMRREPTTEELAEYVNMTMASYREAMGGPPDRTVAVVLPWVEDLDGDES